MYISYFCFFKSKDKEEVQADKDESKNSKEEVCLVHQKELNPYLKSLKGIPLTVDV